jgi:hypothetical protein
MIPAGSCTDHCVVSTKKGTKIEVFRHKLMSPTGLAAISFPSLSTITDILPSIFFIFLCVAFIVQNSSICFGQRETMSIVTKGLCRLTNGFSLTPLAAGLFVFTVLKQVRKGVNRKRREALLKKKV